MEHPTNLIIRDCTSQGSELCHELADALFQHQAAMAKDPLHKEILGNMRYETRLKRSFDNTEEKLLLVAFDGEKPVGYLFATAEEVTEESRRGANAFPEAVPVSIPTGWKLRCGSAPSITSISCPNTGEPVWAMP